jgi:EmrB/QacA subfamily drug resistance transporter
VVDGVRADELAADPDVAEPLPVAQVSGSRRWVALGCIAAAALIVSLDSSVLSVAIPTVLREFHTTLSSLQWVLTGYSLVFASFLVIGGRLGDLHGHRRMFAIGGLLFATGSLMATLSWSVPSLFVGEALIEGVGACLMLPATLAMISTGFRGRHRAAAFSVLGVAIGLGASLGPLLGGFFTTELTWRLAFGINVVVAPLAVLGVLLYLPRSDRSGAKPRLDITGACLIASGMFLLVFAISEGSRYGWWKPSAAFTVMGQTLWPASAPVALVPVAFLLAAVLLSTFVVVERRKEREGRDPLFEFGELRHRGYRYGLVTTSIIALGQLSLILILSVFLQDAVRLSAVEVGVWLIPLGSSMIVGARVGAVIANRHAPIVSVRTGLVLESTGMLVLVMLIDPRMSFWELLPGLVLYGVGIGCASAQLVNVVLSDVDPAKSGVASGANTTMRQVGAGLGVAIISTILTQQTIQRATSNVRATDVPAKLQAKAIAALDQVGTSFSPPRGTAPHDAAVLLHALASGVTDAARPALWYVFTTMVVGLTVSFLVPTKRRPPHVETTEERAAGILEALAVVEPLDSTGELPLDSSRRTS